MRIGYFGGSFDPPHRGHLAVAQAAADAFALTRVLLAPTGRQPLKPGGTTAGYADRLAMVRLLVQEDPRLEASEADAPKPDGTANYTLDTLSQLSASLPAEARLFSIVGADAFADLPQWREPAQLLQACDWIVVNRPGITPQQAIGQAVSAGDMARVHVLSTVNDPVTATRIRACLHSQAHCEELLPRAVWEYIHTHRLYGCAEG